MFNWLKNIIRNWLEEDELNFDLECIIWEENTTKFINYNIIGSNGVYLIGVPINEKAGCRMIRIEEAKNKKQFTKLWMHFCKDKQVTWEDGTPYVPNR